MANANLSDNIVKENNPKKTDKKPIFIVTQERGPSLLAPCPFLERAPKDKQNSCLLQKPLLIPLRREKLKGNKLKNSKN
jgi:hypothetical protein